MQSINYQVKKTILLFLALILSIMFVACESHSELDYYSEENNYIIATGIICHIAYSSDQSALYLAFSDLNPSFDDDTFKIVGKNLSIVQKNGIGDKIQLGDVVTFTSAPLYLGDGYVMPIVSLSVEGEVLLNYEEGFPNFLEWLSQ